MTAQQQLLMPSVINRPLSEATSIIGRYRLRIDTVRAAGPPERALIVVQQSPQAGAPITRETIVRLVVSMIVVPDLTGTLAVDAAKLLSAHRLQLGRAVEVRTEGAPGAVVRQSPGARTLVAPDQPVSIYYVAPREEPPQVLMPSVINQTLSAATSIIGQYRLRIDTLRVAGPPENALRIVRQSPSAGTPITSETVARIVVSMIAVPDLTGMDDAQVSETLARHRLRIGEVTTEILNGDSGTVLRQQPRARELVMPAAAVDVVYVQPEPQSPPPPPPDNPPPQTTTSDAPTSVQPPPRVDSVTVPGVRGWSLGSARRILEASGLRLGTTRIAIATDTLTFVLSQAPDSGVQVPRGTAVDVTIPTLVTTSRNRPIWPWLAGGLLMLIGAVAAIRKRLSDRERDRVDRARKIITVSPVAPVKLDVQTRTPLRDASIRYVVRSGGTRIAVRAQVPFVIKEDRIHV